MFGWTIPLRNIPKNTFLSSSSFVVLWKILAMFVCLSVYLLLFMHVGQNSLYFISVLCHFCLSYLDANASSESIPSAVRPKVTAGPANIFSGGLDSLTLICTHSDFIFPLTKSWITNDTTHTHMITGCIKQSSECHLLCV